MTKTISMMNNNDSQTVLCGALGFRESYIQVPQSYLNEIKSKYYF